jgi:AraC-like DNA-binding protein
MPLFMDYHKTEGVNIADVKNAHLADLAVQDKYGVKYHQFWVNEVDGTVFCLMEGPDKKSCEQVHREAHGTIACAITEVEPGFYELFMGKAHIVDQAGLVVNADGSNDNGFRYIMATSIHGVTPISNSGDYKSLRIPELPRKLVSQKATEFNGRRVDWTLDDSLVNVFDSAANAVQCSREIQSELKAKQTADNSTDWRVSFRIGVSASQPVTEGSDFFCDATRLACRLSNLAKDNEIIVSSLVDELYHKRENGSLKGSHAIKSLKRDDETFITSVFTITEGSLSDEDFTIKKLCKDVGVSQPQFYRKIVNLTGKSPNGLIRDLRMSKAINLLKSSSLNIAQVALEVGYNNPSYFTKCFTEKFGCTPSRFVEVG